MTVEEVRLQALRLAVKFILEKSGSRHPVDLARDFERYLRSG